MLNSKQKLEGFLYLPSEIPHQNNAFNPEVVQRFKKKKKPTQTELSPLEPRYAVNLKYIWGLVDVKLSFISALPGWRTKSHRHQSLVCADSRAFTSNCWRREAEAAGHLQHSPSILLRGFRQLFPLSIHKEKDKAYTYTMNPQRKGTLEAQRPALSF